MDYLRDPQAIYDRSFEIIRAEANLSRFSRHEQAIAIRMIHACGMTDLPNDLIISPKFVDAAQNALGSGNTIFVDAEMVRHGIITRTLRHDIAIICTLNDPCAKEIATAKGITRSAAAVELWDMDNALVVIGNAPTALFHLLEIINGSGTKPAAVIGLPVGFVGAAESKEELIRESNGVPYLTLKGRRGGSAMAAAVVNALTGDL